MPAQTAPHPKAPHAQDRLTEAQFALIARLAHREAGLAIAPNKNAMVYSRIMKQMRAQGLTDIDAYVHHMAQTRNRDDLAELVCALTTNVTRFFREPHHFDLLKSDILPRLAKQARAGQQMRLWSAGCADGMEPYSMAMVCAEACMGINPPQLRILGTDINQKVIAEARRGIFSAQQAQHVPARLRQTVFEPCTQRGVPAQDASWVRVAPHIARMVTFNTLNLMKDWPMQRGFDVIFCRNVLIYFDDPTQKRLLDRLASVLQPGGWLFLGHSERLQDPTAQQFDLVGPTTYRKRCNRAAMPASERS